jgi:hypothetical protein
MAALQVAGNLNTWKTPNSFADWIDGTSNQFVVGEKYIPPDYLGKCVQNAATSGLVPSTGYSTRRQEQTVADFIKVQIISLFRDVMSHAQLCFACWRSCQTGCRCDNT